RPLVQQFTIGRVVQPANGSALIPVRMVGDLFRVPHRLVDDVVRVHDRGYLFLRLVGRPLFQSRINLHLTLGFDADILLRVLRGQGGFANRLAQAGEVLVLVRADQDVTFFHLLGVLGLGV